MFTVVSSEVFVPIWFANKTANHISMAFAYLYSYTTKVIVKYFIMHNLKSP